MNCQYYKRSENIGTCCFAFSCMEDCYFRYKYDTEYIEELEQDNKELREELWENCCTENDLHELEEQKQEIENYKENLLEFTKYIVGKVDMPEQQFKEELSSACLSYEDEKEIERVYNERR